MSQEVMTVEEVAAYLSISPESVYDKVATRDIPHMKLGRMLRFPKSVIDQWLAENTVRPLPDFYDELARSASRWLFMQWLSSKGLDYRKVAPEAVQAAVAAALGELQATALAKPEPPTP